MHNSIEKKVIYLPGLNGIRAIAAIGVVLHHLILALGHFDINPILMGTLNDGTPRGLDLGSYGVTMFFTLSGFLITYLLQKERAIGPIDIKKFYARRALRIWPLYYGFMLVACTVGYFSGEALPGETIALYALLGANIAQSLGMYIELLHHYWSLGVEEQFYLFWPWLNKLKSSTFVRFSIFLIVIMVGIKLYLHFQMPNTYLEKFISVSRFHCMAIGGVAAVWFLNQKSIVQICTYKAVQLCSWLIIILLATNRFHIASIIDNEIISVITVFIIIGQITKKGLLNLEQRSLNYLGKLSYGIYVIHPLIILGTVQLKDWLPQSPVALGLSIVLVVLVGTIAAAHLSYKYFESPFLRLKSKRYSIVNSTNNERG